MSANDGGPAYPVTLFEGQSLGDGSANGMSLLDHFAGLAMQGYRANPKLLIADPTHVAAWSYDDAVAMLAERAKRMQPADLTDLPFGGAK